MHSTSLLGLLKEFRGQNLQIFVPLAYAFGRRPNFLKCKLSFGLISKIRLRSYTTHTIYTRNNMGQKCEGNCGLRVLHEILKKNILKI